jgi:hypothetical protein
VGLLHVDDDGQAASPQARAGAVCD